MNRSPEAPRRRPSRIYAGIELSQPVNPAVPIALCFVFYAVRRVRSLFWGMYVSSRPRRNSGGFFETPEGTLDKAELESAMDWLIVGALACLLGIAFRWWRGRREWGDVPLGYGIGLSGFVYLLASWFKFHAQGRGVSLGLFDDGFGAALLFMLVLGFLAYMCFELFTRRWRHMRVLVAGLLLIVTTVPAIALHYGIRVRLAHQLQLEDGSPLVLDLPFVRSPHSSCPGPFGAEGEVPVYFHRNGELWLGQLDFSSSPSKLVGLLPVDSEPATEAERRARSDKLDRMRLGLAESHRPFVPVALSSSATPGDLARVVRDIRQRFPGAQAIDVIGTTGGERARGASLPGETGPIRRHDAVLMRLDVETREPFVVLDVQDSGSVAVALGEQLQSLTSVRDGRSRGSWIQVRLRVDESVTLEQLGAI